MKLPNSKRIMRLLCLTLLLSIFPLCAFALPQPGETTEQYGEVVVCGNRHCEPIELYANGEYVGAMPALFDMLAEQTGLRFLYLQDNAEDAYALAQSGQCDILSAVAADAQTLAAYSLIAGPVCFRYQGVEYRIAYTQRVPASLIETINVGIENLPESAKTISALKGADKLYDMRIPLWVVGVVVALTIGCAVLSILILYRNAKQKRRLETDALTGLKSKLGLLRACDKLKKHRQLSLYMLAYIALDLEKLRLIFGQPEADERMQQAAVLLKNSLQAHWIAARVDDFGFVICFPAANQEEASRLLQPILGRIRESLNANQGSLQCELYTGVCRADSVKSETNTSIDTARLVASCAKERDTALLFSSPELINKAAFDYRTAQDILASINLDAFEVYALPQVDPQSMEIRSAQALVRWNHPQMGLLLPGSFMPAIEDTEKIKELDAHVFEEVCAWIHHRSQHNRKPLMISCNISATSLKDADFHLRLQRHLAAYNLPKNSIALEIDSAVLSDGEAIVNNIAKLSSYGVVICIDNFGSANTSLRSLAEYNVYQVKLARELLPNNTSDKATLARSLLLLHNTVNICRKLGLHVCVSGVENALKHELAKGLECELAEGYYYFHPMPKAEFDKL